VLTPMASALILVVTATSALLAWQAQPKDRPVPKVYWAWLNEDVVYIITPQERAAFLALTTDDERKQFMVQFWKRRDPTPDTVENEFKEEHYRRIAYANQHFVSQMPGWKTDHGRIYIVYGPPDEIESHPKGDKVRTYPFEQWRYHHIQNVGDNIIIDFADPNWSGEYRMTKDPN
jgi:GWxTD domain-containing protein